MGAQRLRKHLDPASEYKKFDELDGSHPWMQTVPDGFVAYKVRELQQGEISYFNFNLAKEIGLIPKDHSFHLTKELKNKILKTFCLQIINEFDELNNRKIDPQHIKKNKYMASRYLQLQHANKQGKTSGDGRAIWNGTIKHHGKTWDISSRGTGVTCLAPGSVEANKPLQTGKGTFGYGCGLAEIDELYCAAILAESFYLQGIPTERVLCIIDLGKGYGIGVRAAQNLLRPAHLFRLLKQNKHADLKNAFDYFIQRQIQNKKLNPNVDLKNLPEFFCKSFAEFTAKLDIDYIFAWLDWDGDNLLLDCGIIDYGSVRQFGSRHDKYRYDDVERFSTNLNEQRTKAKLIVQVLAQMLDYLKTGKKKNLTEFRKHHSVQNFNKYFSESRANRLLYRMGFNETQRKNILKDRNLFDAFDKEFSYFERAKVSGSTRKVSDGINHPALFNMRTILRTLPKHFLKNRNSYIEPKIFFKSILTTFAKKQDTTIRQKHVEHIKKFQYLYLQVLEKALGKNHSQNALQGISNRAYKLNREDRITGNALINIVFELLDQIKKGLPSAEIQKIIDQFVFMHLGIPEVKVSEFYNQKPRLHLVSGVFSKMLNFIEMHKDDI